MKRIIIAFPREQNCNGVVSIFKKIGINDIQICDSGIKVLELVEGSTKGLIICSYRLKDMFSSKLINQIPEGYSMLMLVANPSLCESIDSRISVLTLPINKGNFLATINMLLNKNKFKKSLSTEENLIIQKAKDLLIKERNFTEQQAHRYLQVNSMNNGRKMIETSKRILEGSDNNEEIRNCN
ncbi:ANTAR domain-containing response regulator [Clostridium cellulovorans]|uniref:ANTAR domain protein n=1 Tax=Clostridium cellulovorans (strain ATCC 35296 / DSM 3052 / OCM 3 / 743B) TaxID=573061 RepID=D9SSP9_CLOC7|nr:ANTAR domain-containing protein [Clostridium cellulovorans]ADL52561.1 ANTAR domain protein [Clostridium cellulovorans 743B]